MLQLAQHQLSISASLSFSLDSFLLLYLDSRSTRLDSASRRAGGALSRFLNCCYILLLALWNSLLATAKLPRYINKLERFRNLPTSRASNLPRGLAKNHAKRQKYLNCLTLKTYIKLIRHQNLSNKR